MATICIAAPKCKQSARYLCQKRQAKHMSKETFDRTFAQKKKVYVCMCVYNCILIYVYVYLYTIFIRFIYVYIPYGFV